MPNTFIHHPSSYRDPSGFIFEKNRILYRQVNLSFKEHFDHFISSGCYEHLVKKDLLISHENIPENLTGSSRFYKIIRPERIEFISHPSEWSFDMLKDAALLTLQLAKEALQYNMALKDASPFNIQWHKGKLIFIDTLSFEMFENTPWIAYRQICESFLGPLLIMHYSKKQLPELMLAWPDGIPLPIIQSLLPFRSRFSLYTYLHIHLHTKYSNKKNKSGGKLPAFSKQRMLRLILSLEVLVKKLKVPLQKSAWSQYYDEASQRNNYLDEKKKIISAWADQLKDLRIAADLGANEGEFSHLIAGKNIYTLAADFDPYCINSLYRKIKTGKEKNIHPFVIDLSHPTPATGVNNEEREPFMKRANADLVMALALVHHLSIGKNIPFEMLSDMFSRMGKNLIIEFIPKEDEKIKLMLSRKKELYPGYSESGFENAFDKFFSIVEKKPIPGTGRILYLMQRK